MRSMVEGLALTPTRRPPAGQGGQEAGPPPAIAPIKVAFRRRLCYAVSIT